MRRILLCLAVISGIAALPALPTRAEQAVDLELVLLADASRSIDDAEAMFQRRGYATAITSREVLGAIGHGFLRRIAVTYVEWGDETSQEVVVPWTVIDGPASAAAFVEALMQAPRKANGPNAIGSALTAGLALLEGNEIDGTRRVIDFSGDSAWSGGGVPVQQARAAVLAAGVTINGLAVLCLERACSGRPVDYDLETAFETFITGGPGNFVVTADGSESFAEAVRRKLVLEIAGDPAAARRLLAGLTGGRPAVRE